MAEVQGRLAAVVNQVMALPHIVSGIIQCARTDRPSLARLMRTNRNFYTEVGPVLYDTVAVWEKTFESFFRGAFDPVGDDISSFTAPISILLDNRLLDHAHFPQFVNRRPTPSYRADGVDSAAHIGLPFSKQELLSFVRVLTLGSHKADICARFYVPFLKYTTNVEVFRIVDTPLHEAVTMPLCENMPVNNVPQHPCPITSAINPRKLVLRNLSHKTIPFPPLWSLNSNTKEVVLVLPTVEAYLHDHDNPDGLPSRIIWSFSGQFYAADTLKIVFWSEWDHSVATLGEARRVLCPDFSPPNIKVDRTRPLSADTMGILVNLCKGTRHPTEYMRRAPRAHEHTPHIKFYGISSLKLAETKRSMLVRQFQELNPNLAVPDLHTLVKLEALRSETYIVRAMPATQGRQVLLLSCPDVKLYTIGNYKRQRNEAEISQWD